ncbi:MAG TPA: phospholipase [Microscillaceae bacterium]|jgi:predicted peptidase|nr:phospholipase [Microscillaceae bacterium]
MQNQTDDWRFRGCFILFLSISMLMNACQSSAPLDENLFTQHRFTQQGYILPYRLLMPENYKPSSAQKYPLVLFLHGADERGHNNTAHLSRIKGLFLNPYNHHSYPCFVLAPQCPMASNWRTAPTHALLLGLLQEISENYPIDPNRLYITGLSMGGFGTWDMIASYPQRFAAAIPICGGGQISLAANLKNMPIWAFHGAQDDVVGVSYTREMIQAIRQAGGKPRYTEYADVKHDSWVNAYQEPELLEWLFSQKRN